MTTALSSSSSSSSSNAGPMASNPFLVPPSPDSNDYNEYLLTIPSNRNGLLKYVITELRNLNVSEQLDRSPLAMSIGLTEAFNAAPPSDLAPAGASSEPTLAQFGAGPGSAGGVGVGAGQSQSQNGSPGFFVEGSGGRQPHGAHSRPYFGDFFWAFNQAYWPFHCITGLIICALGIFANLINIIVLTRPNMITAVNVILSTIALSDLIVNSSNIPYLLHDLEDQTDRAKHFTYGWAFYTLVHAHISVTAHTISVWLTCVLATWRYCVVCRSQTSNQRNWSMGLAKKSIVVVILFVPVFCIPNYLSFSITTDGSNPSEGVVYSVGFSRLAETSQFIKTFHFWIFSFLVKLMPCILLTFFTSALIRKLLSARERRLRLASHGSTEKNTLHSGKPTSMGQNGNQPRKFSLDDGCQMKVANGAVKIEVGSATLDSIDKSESKFVELPNNVSSKDTANKSRSTNVDLESKLNDNQNQNQNQSQSHSHRALSVDYNHNEPTGNNKINHRLAPNSASSCATDAEMLPASPNTSTSDTIGPEMTSIALGPKQQQQSARILSQLVVETTTSAANTTTVSTTAAPTKMLASYNRNKASPVKQSQHDNNGNGADLESRRSASTCGALELYACSVGGGERTRPQLIQSSVTVSQDLAKNQHHRHARYSAGASCASSTMNILASDDNNNNNNNTAHNDQPKPPSRAGARSIGSGSLAPFQIVKLQATKRQLNQNETTTRLLIAVMIVFLICESPAGILSVLCAVFGQEFFDNVYQPMGILTDLLALINSSVNFVLYCFMSTQFRVTFYQVVLHCPAPQQPSARNHTNANNGSFKNKLATREANKY